MPKQVTAQPAKLQFGFEVICLLVELLQHFKYAVVPSQHTTFFSVRKQATK